MLLGPPMTQQDTQYAPVWNILQLHQAAEKEGTWI